MKSNDSAPDSQTREGGVLDPSWEQALRAGQEADGGAGSVEGELAVLHLLRHVRAPEHLPEAALEELWRDVDGAITPTPWWRRSWLLWGAPVAVAAAALVIVLRPGGEVTSPLPDTGPAVAMSVTLEQQFAMLEPEARGALARTVDDRRGALRGQLLASAAAAADTESDVAAPDEPIGGNP
ncbi:MAG: hypothetical protein H6713_08560 [Myxococcales bacterium]|nr:hypothetical protein [Myxococcales bacterium]MCB9750039.1 hypothetical protein [Myxococcales bacterium]